MLKPCGQRLIARIFSSMKTMAARKPPISVIQRGKSWEYYYDHRNKPCCNSQKRKRGYASKQDALLAGTQEWNRRHLLEIAPGAVHTLEKIAEAWVGQLRVKTTTRERYERDIRVHILSELGHREVNEITTPEMVNFFDNLRQKGGRSNPETGKELSFSSRCGIYTVLNQLYQWALVRGFSTESPLSGLDRRVFVGREQAALDLEYPVGLDANQNFQAMTREEQEHFVNLLDTWTGQRNNKNGHQWREAWLIALGTGIRLGELLGLADMHIDTKEKRLLIRQQVTVSNHEMSITGPKSQKSVREIAIDDHVLGLLREQQRKRFKYQQEMGKEWPNHGLLFTHPNGQNPHPDRFSRELRRFMRVVGLRPIRFHGLRHTWATRALEEGVPLSVVSHHLGHADEIVTARVYQHVTQEFSRAATAAENAIFKKG